MINSQAVDKEIKAYKGFDENLKCRDFQYELGKTYTHEGSPVRCHAAGFHSCEYPLDIFSYYPPTSRFCEVVASGEVDTSGSDSKIASATITINAEISIHDIVKRSIEWVLSRCKKSNESIELGDRSVSSNTGYLSVSSNTGYLSVSSNTGDRSVSSVSGKNSVAASFGYKSKAKASKGSAIVLCYRDDKLNLIHIKAGVAGKEVKPDVWYSLDENGDFKECL